LPFSDSDFFVWVGRYVYYFIFLNQTYVIDTNYGNTTKILNIPETGTLLKYGTDRNENFGNINFLILKTAIKSFELRRFFWVGRLTANKQYFNLGLMYIIVMCFVVLLFFCFCNFMIEFLEWFWWYGIFSIFHFIFFPECNINRLFELKFPESTMDKINNSQTCPWGHLY
jgi:hypothetical protein